MPPSILRFVRPEKQGDQPHGWLPPSLTLPHKGGEDLSRLPQFSLSGGNVAFPARALS